MTTCGEEETGLVFVAGKPFPVGAPVRTWHESGLYFAAIKPRERTTCLILHWTGSENLAESVHRHMRSARLSVHFVVDAAGVVWQMMDADRYGAHCQGHGANAYSVGIELINRGSAVGLPDQGVARVIRAEKIHGKVVRYTAFTAVQRESCLKLLETLCRVYAIPMRVPLVPRGEVMGTMLALGDARRFRGVMGHLHMDRQKVDPGLELLTAVHQRGLEIVHRG